MSGIMLEDDLIGATPSPFIEGTNVQLAWDATSLTWAKTCPRLYEYNMIHGYRPKNDNIHLRFGIEYHTALQQYDMSRANGLGHEDSVHDVISELMRRLETYKDPEPDDKASIRVKTKRHLIRTVVWYLDQFQDDPAQTWKLRNGKPACELTFKFELEYGPILAQQDFIRNAKEGQLVEPSKYLLCGHLDRIVNYLGDLYVMDRKTTTSTVAPYYFDRYEPDNQMTLYSLAGQVVINAPIRGVIVDVAQVAVTFSRFARGFTYRTKDQLDEWRYDIQILLGNMERYAREGYWPQNDTACDKYGGCRFRHICARSPKVRQAFLDSDFTKENPWNPLEIR
jgi:hypothetical protein